jgi:hypothetical protein
MPHSYPVNSVNSHSGFSKYAYLEDVVPQLGLPNRCATWIDLEGILAGGSIDGLTGAVGRGVNRQLVVIHSEDCRLDGAWRKSWMVSTREIVKTVMYYNGLVV